MKESQDAQPRIESDEVDHLKRTHRMVQSELQRFVDVTRRSNAFLQHIKSFITDHCVNTRRHEPGRLLYFHRFFAHPLGNRFRNLEGLLACLQTTNDFNELHFVNGLEKVISIKSW